MIAGFIANTMVPVDQSSSTQEIFRNYSVQITALRASPIALFQEGLNILLVPGARTMSEILQIQQAGSTSFVGGALPLNQSLLIMWPNVVTLVASTAVLFAISYYKFMRDEIRST